MIWRVVVVDACTIEAKCREKTLEKSGLKPTAPNHLADRNSPIGVLRMSIVNILRGLPCRLESLRLKFTNEPSIFLEMGIWLSR